MGHWLHSRSDAVGVGFRQANKNKHLLRASEDSEAVRASLREQR